MKGFSLPKIGIKTNGQFFVHFKVDGERFRFSNGKVIDSPHSPNRVEGAEATLSRVAQVRLHISSWERVEARENN